MTMGRPPSPIEMEKLVAMVPVDLFNRLRAEAESHDRTVSAEVRRAIRQYLDEEKDVA